MKQSKPEIEYLNAESVKALIGQTVTIVRQAYYPFLLFRLDDGRTIVFDGSPDEMEAMIVQETKKQ